jgi:hypothetical protein
MLEMFVSLKVSVFRNLKSIPLAWQAIFVEEIIRGKNQL